MKKTLQTAKMFWSLLIVMTAAMFYTPIASAVDEFTTTIQSNEIAAAIMFDNDKPAQPKAVAALLPTAATAKKINLYSTRRRFSEKVDQSANSVLVNPKYPLKTGFDYKDDPHIE